MRLFILSLFVFLVSIHSVILPQESEKVWANVELGAGFITGGTFENADSTFNLGPDYNVVQMNLDYWISENILAGATWEVGFNPAFGADSTAYTSLGVQFLWMFNPRIHLIANPSYAIIEMNGFESWINFLVGFRIWINPDLAYVKVAGKTLDGRNPFFEVALGLRVN